MTTLRLGIDARLARCLAPVMAVAVWLGAARVARAGEQATDVVVVDLAPGASELDADELRKAIGQELHARVVGPADPAAASAKGTLTVDLDRHAGQVSVQYAARTSPTTRHVPLPADPAATRSAIVALAGNLARDEAGELAAELRGARGGAATAGPEAPGPTSTSGTSAASPTPEAKGTTTATRSDEAKPEAIDPDRLRATIDRYAAEERASFAALRWAGLTVAGAGIAGELTLYATHGPSSLAALAASGGAFGVALVLDTALLPAPFAELARSTRREFPAETEARWARLAQEERSRRDLTGVVGLAAAGVAWGVATYVVTANPNPSPQTLEWAASGYAVGAIAVFVALPQLMTDGPVASGLHAYETSVGRVLRPVDTTSARLDVTPMPGGAFGSFTMRF
jgi:hypothetical protein